LNESNNFSSNEGSLIVAWVEKYLFWTI